MTVANIRQQNRILEQIFYHWKSKYGGVEISAAKKLKQLEDGNRGLKWIIEKTRNACPQT